MRSSLRRGLSAVAALALVLGSALVASPAQAAAGDSPVIDITSPVDGSSVAGFTLQATVTDDELWYWTSGAYGPEAYTIWVGPKLPGDTPYASPVTISVPVDTSTWVNGVYDITIVARDIAQNEGSDTVQVTVTNGLPSTGFWSPTEWSIHDGGGVQFTGRLASVYQYASYSVDGGPYTTLFAVAADDSSAKNFDFTVTGLSDGNHYVVVSLGPGEGAIVRNFTVDGTPPVINLNDSYFGLPGTTSIQVVAGITDATPVWYDLRNIYTPDLIDIIVKNHEPYGTGPISEPFDTSDWVAEDLGHFFAIYAVDAAGNSTFVQVPMGIDSVNPKITFTKPDAYEVISGSTVIKGKATDSASGAQWVDLYVHPLKLDGTCKTNTVVGGASIPAAVADAKWSLQLGGSAPADGDYCLRVVGGDFVGHTDTARVLPVTFDSTAPTAPSVIEPDGFQEGGQTSLSWNASSDAHAVTYEVLVDDDPDVGDDPIFDFTTDETEYDLGELSPGHYWWKVRAVDAAGNKSDWSDKTKFTVIGVPIVSLCGCGYGPGYFGKDLGIDWTEVYGPGGVKRYEIELSYEGDPSVSDDDILLTGEVDGTILSYDRTFANGRPVGEWTVRVRAVYENRLIANDPDSKFGPWSDPVSAIRVRPGTPILLTPDDEYASANDDFDFTWLSVPDAIFYEFRYNQTGELNTKGRLKDPDYGFACEPSFDPLCPGPVLDAEGIPEGEYWWQVRAVDLNNNPSEWSDIRHVTVDFTAPAQVSLLSLNNGATSKSKKVTFGWSPLVESGVSYQLEASHSSSFTNALHGSSAGTSLQLSTLTNGTYFWHVRAIDKAGNAGPWSATWTVKVALPVVAFTGSGEPEAVPTAEPTDEPTAEPSGEPTGEPTDEPSAEPTDELEASPAGDSGFPVIWIVVIVLVVLAGGGFLIRFLIVRR